MDTTSYPPRWVNLGKAIVYDDIETMNSIIEFPESLGKIDRLNAIYEVNRRLNADEAQNRCFMGNQC